ncbi:hypothetical protein AB0D90_03645 [Streptomyces althioticus]|uniref:hypothetical protein n=1 Tax=Streptomyces althioticus TaxID=83380 RepID=UPI0034089F42
MAATPRLTENRARHLLFTALARPVDGPTRIAFINNGGRSKLVALNFDGTLKHLAPTVHTRLWDDVITAAHEAARAVHGPRRNWPARLTFEAPTKPLTYEDAAPHLGDHVLNNRVYTFSPAAAEAAHRVMRATVYLKLNVPDLYHEAIEALRRLLDLPFDTPTRNVRMLARSYTRAHPQT